MVHSLVNSLVWASVDSGDARWSHNQAGRKAAFRGEGDCHSTENFKKKFFFEDKMYIPPKAGLKLHMAHYQENMVWLSNSLLVHFSHRKPYFLLPTLPTVFIPLRDCR